MAVYMAHTYNDSSGETRGWVMDVTIFEETFLPYLTAEVCNSIWQN